MREYQSKHKEAIKSYAKALKLDPTLWCAFERLCALTPDEVEPAKFFTKDHAFIQNLNQAIIDENSRLAGANPPLANRDHNISSPVQQ